MKEHFRLSLQSTAVTLVSEASSLILSDEASVSIDVATKEGKAKDGITSRR